MYFLLGIISTLLFEFLLLIVILHWLPYYIFPLKRPNLTDQIHVQPKKRRDSTLNMDDIQEQFKKDGWLIIATSPLTRQDVKWSTPVSSPSKSILRKTMDILSTSAFAGNSPKLASNDKLAATEPKSEYESAQMVYAKLRESTLYIYSTAGEQRIMDVIILTGYKIVLSNQSDYDSFYRESPIKLVKIEQLEHAFNTYYIYTKSAQEKEDWFLLLRRASKMNVNSPNKVHSFIKRSDPMQRYLVSMQKLIPKVKNPPSQGLQQTAWLNGLIGRIFVGVHSSPLIKEWLLSSFCKAESKASFLSDIEIRDIHVGDSFPLLFNPKLLDISTTGDMLIEMDIEYTGGVTVEAATLATFSLPSLDKFVKPLDIGVVLKISIKYFSAKVLLKIKPFWETGRIWFGFYKDPPVDLKLDIVPVISNQNIKFELVNQIIQRRIKDGLNEFLVLPNMMDLPFWNSGGAGGIFESFPESEVIPLVPEAIPEAENTTPKPFVMNQYQKSTSFESIEPEAVSEEPISFVNPSPVLRPVIDGAFKVLSSTAAQYKLDQKVKAAVDTAVEYGLDDTARSLADTAMSYGGELVSFIKRTTQGSQSIRRSFSTGANPPASPDKPPMVPEEFKSVDSLRQRRPLFRKSLDSIQDKRLSDSSLNSISDSAINSPSGFRSVSASVVLQKSASTDSKPNFSESTQKPAEIQDSLLLRGML